MLTVASLTKTCNACPAQWEGHLTDGREVYVRYRWGCLTICVETEVGRGVFEGDTLVFDAVLDSEGWAGVLSDDELAAATKGVIEWPSLS